MSHPQNPAAATPDAIAASDAPAQRHRRPPDASDEAIAAAGKVSEALEAVERARGHLYAFHQLTGTADLALDEAVELLRAAGHDALAQRVSCELIGLNVLEGRWTFQVVEEYDEGYYREFRRVEELVRAELTGGRRHVYESEMKERRRTRGRPGHAATPPERPPVAYADADPVAGTDALAGTDAGAGAAAGNEPSGAGAAPGGAPGAAPPEPSGTSAPPVGGTIWAEGT
jgi:hypothetical protein